MQLLQQFDSDSFESLQVLGHDMKMCIMFGYNPQIIFVTFSQNKLSHFSGRSK